MSEPILNPEAIDALRSVSPDDGGAFLNELIDIFLHDTPMRLKELATATAAGDAVTATRAAHSVKGSAGNFGAAGLAHIAFEIEAAGKAGRLDEVAAKQADIEQQFALVRDALSALRTS